MTFGVLEKVPLLDIENGSKLSGIICFWPMDPSYILLIWHGLRENIPTFESIKDIHRTIPGWFSSKRYKLLWLVVQPPLWKILVNWDDSSQYFWENKKWQPNHQPVTVRREVSWVARFFLPENHRRESPSFPKNLPDSVSKNRDTPIAG